MNARQRILNIINQMTDQELSLVLSNLFSSTKIESNEDYTIDCCPHCGSIRIKKNGHTNGYQRYICLDCKKSFSDKTNSFFKNSKISKDKWLKFIDYEITGITLAEEAYYMKLSIPTCFKMRHRIYQGISSYVSDNVRLKDTVELDSAYRKINLKGTKPQNMPRKSKKRGNTSAYSGISHHKLCIASGIDEHDNMFLKVVGLGSESFEKYKKVFHYFDKVDCLVTDSKTSMNQVSNKLGTALDKIETKANQKRYTTKNGNSLGDINELHQEVTKLITRTHGISTRYIQGYLDFITIKKKVHYSFDRSEQASAILSMLEKTYIWNEKIVLKPEMPISLKEAYYEYHYGIFSGC